MEKSRGIEEKVEISEGIRKTIEEGFCDYYQKIGQITSWCIYYGELGCPETCYFARNKIKERKNENK